MSLTGSWLSGVVLSSAISASGTPITTLCAACTPALSAFNVGGVVTVRDGTTVLATVATPNVACTNGVVHVVGAVLVPGNQSIPTRDVVQTALSVPELSNLTNALVATGLVPALTIGPSTPSFTVFAPVNSGWSGVPASVSSNLTTLTSVLQYHVLVGRVYAEDLPVGVAVTRTTLSGQTLSLLRSGSAVTITSTSGNVATVLSADIDTSK
jgi:transforming growth factor-beta-induced protein